MTNPNVFEIGLSSCGNSLDEALFNGYAENKIKYIEISPRQNSETYNNLDYKTIKRLSFKYGINLWSFHLQFVPFEDLEISSASEEIRKKTIKTFTRQIEMGSDIGINKFVVHPSGEPISADERPERMKCAKDTLNSLAEIADRCGSVIAVEDLPRTCLGHNSDEILELISVNDKLRVCLDTNHLVNENNIDFVKKIGDKIGTLHVSDYDGIDEKHWLPGKGIVEWKDLIKALKGVNYSGVWLYELGYKPHETSISDGNITIKDFIDNANKIFAL